VRSTFGLCLVVAVAVTAPVAVAKTIAPPATIAARDRVIDGGRAVLVANPQSQIETSIDIGRIAPLPSGGILDYLIIRSMDDRRDVMGRALRDKADEAVRPLRAELRSIDLDAMAMATTKAALAKLDWFAPTKIEFTKGGSKGDLSAFAASAGTSQIALITYRYGLSPDFTQIRIVADVSLAKASKTTAPTIAYRQTISSIVQLGTRSYESVENAAAWHADGSKRAKTALSMGFSQLEQLIPYALSLSATDAARLTAKNSEMAFAAGVYGPLVEKSSDGKILIWSDGFVQVQTLP
jgi:hypothetical protein